MEKNWYDYLFYKFYTLVGFLGNKELHPEIHAWFCASMCIWLNMLTALNIIELQIGSPLTNKTYVIIFYAVYLLLNYIYFFRKERFKRFLKLYDKEDSKKKLWGTIVVISYVIITLVLHFYFSEQRREMALK